jgi:hypothetical protein
LVEALVGLADVSCGAKADVIVWVGDWEKREEGLNEKPYGSVIVKHWVIKI